MLKQNKKRLKTFLNFVSTIFQIFKKYLEMTKKAQGKVAANSKRWSILQVSRVSTRGSPPASRAVSPFVVGRRCAFGKRCVFTLKYHFAGVSEAKKSKNYMFSTQFCALSSKNA